MVFFIHMIFLITVFFLSHPIRIRISLIFIAILSRSITFYINSSWFFYLIILVFLGGVIILIIYIRTLAANEKFSSSSLSLESLVIISLIALIIVPMYNIKYSYGFVNMNNTALGVAYEASNFSLLMFLIIYLLLTLVCVVKLVKFESGPLIKRL